MTTREHPQGSPPAEQPAADQANEAPTTFDRRAFLMRSAVIGAAAVITDSMLTPQAGAAQQCVDEEVVKGQRVADGSCENVAASESVPQAVTLPVRGRHLCV
jgi:hypothetical protein